MPSADIAGGYPVADAFSTTVSDADEDPWSTEAQTLGSMRPGLSQHFGKLKAATAGALSGALAIAKTIGKKRSGPRVIRSKLGPWVVVAPKTPAELAIERMNRFVRSPVGAVLIAALMVSMVFVGVIVAVGDSSASAAALYRMTKAPLPKAPDPVAAAPVAPLGAPTSVPTPAEPAGPTASASSEDRPARRRVRRTRRGRRGVARAGRGRGRGRVAAAAPRAAGNARPRSSTERDIMALLGN